MKCVISIFHGNIDFSIYRFPLFLKYIGKDGFFYTTK